MRAAISAPKPHVSWSSCATMTRLVFFVYAAIVSQSYGNDRAQVDDGDADAVAFRLLRREQRALDERAPREDDDVGAVARHGGLPERDHVVRPGIRRPCCRSAGTDACARRRAPGRRSGSPCAAVRPRPARSTGTRCACPACARRSRPPTGCDTARRHAGSRRSARESPPGTTSGCPSGSASSTARRESA